MTDENQIKQILLSRGYEYKEMIGSGTSCNVYLCHSDKYHQNFAVKILFNTKLQSPEYDALTSLHHPYIIKLYEAFTVCDVGFLVMEYCSNNTMKHKNRLNFERFIYYSKQILEALSYCHSNKIAHRDLKPDNLFIDQYDRIKLADFGLSKTFGPNIVSNEKCGSLMYCAPEVLKKLPFDPFQADVYALGITFFYMATGTFPFRAKSSDELLQFVKMGSIDFTYVEMKQELKTLIQKMTNKIPKLRPNIDEILNMPMFNEKKALKIKKTLSSAHFNTRSKILASRSFLMKPTFSSDDASDGGGDGGEKRLPLSKAYKSSITHSSTFKSSLVFDVDN